MGSCLPLGPAPCCWGGGSALRPPRLGPGGRFPSCCPGAALLPFRPVPCCCAERHAAFRFNLRNKPTPTPPRLRCVATGRGGGKRGRTGASRTTAPGVPRRGGPGGGRRIPGSRRGCGRRRERARIRPAPPGARPLRRLPPDPAPRPAALREAAPGGRGGGDARARSPRHPAGRAVPPPAAGAGGPGTARPPVTAAEEAEEAGLFFWGRAPDRAGSARGSVRPDPAPAASGGCSGARGGSAATSSPLPPAAASGTPCTARGPRSRHRLLFLAEQPQRLAA